MKLNKFIKYQIIYTLFFFKPNFIFSQEKLEVKLNKVKSTNDIGGFVTPVLISTNFEDYKSSLFKSHPDSTWLGKIVLDREQYWYLSSKEENNKKEYFQKRLIQFKVDTSSLVQEKTKSFVGLLIHLKNQKKTIILDANNNHDFSDDFIYTYPYNEFTELQKYEDFKFQFTQKVSYEKVVNKKITDQQELIQIVPYLGDYHFSTELERQISVYFKVNSFYEGKLEFNDSNWVISAVNQNSNGLTPGCFDLLFNISPLEIKLNKFDWVDCQQEIKVQNIVFVVDSVSINDSIVFLSHRKAQSSDFGWKVGDYIKEPFLKENGIKIKPDKKYYLIDFWGSWCSPCLKELPEIIGLAKNNPNIEIISIACEKNKNDFIRSKKIFEEKNITWTQKFQIIDLPESFQRKLNVRYFPTSIFIDRSGKILFRESGLGNISKLKKKFQLN